ncbi:ornithine cyclodeaminase family protein [Sphingopyxis sp. LARHCG72]
MTAEPSPFQPSLAGGRSRSPDTPVLISGADLIELVSLEASIELVDGAMRKLSAGDVSAPQRWAVPVAANGKLGLMPGVLKHPSLFGVKVLSMFETGPTSGLPSHQGLMLLFEGETGRPVAIVDAAQLTLLRTAAASAVATRALARADARTLALVGCGDQAPYHVAAISAVRPIDEVHLWNRSHLRAESLAAQLRANGVRATIHDEVEAAVKAADIVCTLTSVTEPIVAGRWLIPGQHLNLVGASTIDQCEVDEAVVAGGRYFADCATHCRAQAGELSRAIDAGVVDEGWIAGEIGEVLSEKVAGRSNPSEITIYKSLGHAAQDLVVAEAAWRLARPIV